MLFYLASTRVSVRAHCRFMCKIQGFTDALSARKSINNGLIAENKKNIFGGICEIPVTKRDGSNPFVDGSS